MSFCCGASMIGTNGTLKHYRTHIHNVPVLYCPICERVVIHHLIENEYEILAEYAHGDGAAEVDFLEYVGQDDPGLFENCVNNEKEDPAAIVSSQIDMALDLLQFAKQIGDAGWETELKRRLSILGQRHMKLRQQRTSEGYC